MAQFRVTHLSKTKRSVLSNPISALCVLGPNAPISGLKLFIEFLQVSLVNISHNSSAASALVVFKSSSWTSPPPSNHSIQDPLIALVTNGFVLTNELVSLFK